MMKKFVCPLIGIILGALLGFVVTTQCQCVIIWDWNMIAALAAVIGVIVSSLTYWHSVERAKKIETLREFSAIREKYFDGSSNTSTSLPTSDEKRYGYLQALERFCAGINLGVYDIEVIEKTSKTMLIRQYGEYKGYQFVDTEDASEGFYCEFEEVIKKLKEGDQPVCPITKNNLK